jgi:hypothetical protein
MLIMSVSSLAVKTVSVAAMVTILTTRALDERSRGDYPAIASMRALSTKMENWQ